MITKNGFFCVFDGEAFASVFLRSLLSLLVGAAAAGAAGVLLRDFFLPLRLLAVPFEFFDSAVMVMVCRIGYSHQERSERKDLGGG